jgi:hypothetical protein
MIELVAFLVAGWVCSWHFLPCGGQPPTLFIHCCIAWHLQAVGFERDGGPLVMDPFHCKRFAMLQASAWS